jgi:hypothetical protein
MDVLTKECSYREDPMSFEMQSSALLTGHDASSNRRDVGRRHGLHATGRVLGKVCCAASINQSRINGLCKNECP